MSKSLSPQLKRGFEMKVLSLSDCEYDTSWMHDDAVSVRRSKELPELYSEYNYLVSKICSGENFSKAINNLHILERDDSKYQLIFLRDFLPASMKVWHRSDYVFKAIFSDFMPLQVTFQPQLRELDNW